MIGVEARSVRALDEDVLVSDGLALAQRAGERSLVGAEARPVRAAQGERVGEVGGRGADGRRVTPELGGALVEERDLAALVAAAHSDGERAQQMLEPAFAPDHLLGALPDRHVADHDATRELVSALGRRGFESRPEDPVAPAHAQLERLDLAVRRQLPPALVVEILVLGDDVGGQPLPEQLLLGNAEQRAGAQVRLSDEAGRVQREISDRREVVELEVTLARSFQRLLRPAQLLDVHLELDLVDAQLVKQASRFLSRVRPRAVSPDGRRLLLGPLSETAIRGRVRHGVSLRPVRATRAVSVASASQP